jgi:hypothetical protein
MFLAGWVMVKSASPVRLQEELMQSTGKFPVLLTPKAYGLEAALLPMIRSCLWPRSSLAWSSAT